MILTYMILWRNKFLWIFKSLLSVKCWFHPTHFLKEPHAFFISQVSFILPFFFLALLPLLLFSLLLPSLLIKQEPHVLSQLQLIIIFFFPLLPWFLFQPFRHFLILQEAFQIFHADANEFYELKLSLMKIYPRRAILIKQLRKYFSLLFYYN